MNGPLQHRGFIFDHDLDKDFFASETFDDAGDTYVDYEFFDVKIPHCNETKFKKTRVCQEEVVDEENATTIVYHSNYDLYRQKRLVNSAIVRGEHFDQLKYLGDKTSIADSFNDLLSREIHSTSPEYLAGSIGSFSGLSHVRRTNQ